VSYQGVLPQTFAWVTDVPRARVPELVALLATFTTRHPGGSSFAVTVDNPDPNRVNLWLSETSLKRLREGLAGYRFDVKPARGARE
jgi:hypothetical protein